MAKLNEAVNNLKYFNNFRKSKKSEQKYVKNE